MSRSAFLMAPSTGLVRLAGAAISGLTMWLAFPSTASAQRLDDRDYEACSFMIARTGLSIMIRTVLHNAGTFTAAGRVVAGISIGAMPCAPGTPMEARDIMRHSISMVAIPICSAHGMLHLMVDLAFRADSRTPEVIREQSDFDIIRRCARHARDRN